MEEDDKYDTLVPLSVRVLPSFLYGGERWIGIADEYDMRGHLVSETICIPGRDDLFPVREIDLGFV